VQLIKKEHSQVAERAIDEVMELQEAIEKRDDKVDSIETIHNFSEGQYIRQVLIPAGMLVIGKRHRHKTLNVVLKGKCKIRNSDQEESYIAEAPYMYESGANVKKAVYAYTDTIFANIHVTNEINKDKLEEQCIITEEDYNRLIENKEYK